MRIIKKVIIFIVITGTISVIGYFVLFTSILSSTKTEVQKIYFQKYDEILYLKNEKRGLNYEMTAITKAPKRKINTIRDKNLLYPNGGTLFYKAESDTLIIYTMLKAKIPKGFETNIIIKQKEISNPEFIEMKTKYKEIGLKKFPE